MCKKSFSFNDTQSANETLRLSSLRKCKAPGSKVDEFDAVVWDPAKQSVVEQENYLKYTSELLKMQRSRRDISCRPRIENWSMQVHSIVFGECASPQINAKEAGVKSDGLGQNLIGKVLVILRKKMRERKPKLLMKSKALDGSQPLEPQGDYKQAKGFLARYFENAAK